MAAGGERAKMEIALATLAPTRVIAARRSANERAAAGARSAPAARASETDETDQRADDVVEATAQRGLDGRQVAER
jgi:hypothetical protein